MLSLDQAVPKSVGSAIHDRTRFERHVSQTRKGIGNLIYRRLGDISEAEDILQETYVRAWRHYAQYDPTRSFEAWVTRIAENLCIDFYRQRKHKGLLSLDSLVITKETDVRLAQELMGTTHDPARCLLEQEIEENLVDSLRGLSNVYLSCLLLISQGYSYDDIAAIMRCPVGSVRSRIHRARQLVKRTLTA